MASSSSSSPTVSDPSEFTLISSDNRRFFIPSTASALSGRVIKRRLQNKAWPENVVVLEKHNGKALEPVAEYLRGNGRASHDGEMKRRFDSEFLSAPGSVGALFNTVLDLEIPGLVALVSEKLSDVAHDVGNVGRRNPKRGNLPFLGAIQTPSSSDEEADD